MNKVCRGAEEEQIHSNEVALVASLDADLLLMACLKYMSENEVRDMAKLNEFLFESELQ